jgi:hypothetical protein
MAFAVPKEREDIIIKVATEVKGNDIIAELRGSSLQVDWGGNVRYDFTYAYVFMALKSMFGPDLPNNDGCARPIYWGQIKRTGCSKRALWVSERTNVRGGICYPIKTKGSKGCFSSWIVGIRGG